MSKAEQLFKEVDFSHETDFKDRLRKHLFEDSEKSLSNKEWRDGSDGVYDRRVSARQLSLEELEHVNAAGILGVNQGLRNPVNRLKFKRPHDWQEKSPWTDSFSGDIPDHDIE